MKANQRFYRVMEEDEKIQDPAEAAIIALLENRDPAKALELFDPELVEDFQVILDGTETGPAALKRFRRVKRKMESLISQIDHGEGDTESIASHFGRVMLAAVEKYERFQEDERTARLTQALAFKALRANDTQAKTVAPDKKATRPAAPQTAAAHRRQQKRGQPQTKIPNGAPTLITRLEFATLLRITPGEFDKRRRRGEYPEPWGNRKKGDKLIFRMTDVQNYIDGNTPARQP